MCVTSLLLGLLVRLLTVREENFPGAYLAFGNLFCILDYLAPPCKGKRSVLLQLDVPCFVQAHGSPVTFWMEMEEWIGRGTDKKGEEM